MSETNILVLLISIFIADVILLFYINKSSSNNNQMKLFFSLASLCVLLILFGQILQISFSDQFNIPYIYFDYIVYAGIAFLPVCVFFICLVFKNTKIQFKKSYLLLLVIPIIDVLVLWTNDFHHLFYKTYSIVYSSVEPGPFLLMHIFYSYILFFIAIISLVNTSVRNAGYFSKQAILFLVGILIPLIVNILGFTKVLDLPIYASPLTFFISLLLSAIAIFKFNFLDISPIALQKIVNIMSDSYIVLNNEGLIVDFNATFLRTFKMDGETLRNTDFFKDISGDIKASFKSTYDKVIKTKKIHNIRFYDSNRRKHFIAEISPIINNDILVGIFILFKDVTQHENDIKIIKEKQDALMESERLSSLGQLIGGIAHNFKTPIMSISGAAEGISDLIKEYDSSIGDPQVTEQDHYDIAKDMSDWVDKIKEYTAYMSDIITAVRGQAITLSENEDDCFDLDELVKRVNILMKHELKNAVVYLNVHMDIDSKTTINGDINSLVQVLNNIISNAIQAYDGKPEQNIDLTFTKKKNRLLISIKDYGPGLSDKVSKKLFKEMITTKGKNGTGIGLYMSYSTIKAHFNGNLSFDTKAGKGTTFYISLPISN